MGGCRRSLHALVHPRAVSAARNCHFLELAVRCGCVLTNGLSKQFRLLAVSEPGYVCVRV
eukprot:m.341370 g.341370  ORF g.341370 m.341370 type:complete len:60 (-) comp55764_c0_seq1:102-281(-)